MTVAPVLGTIGNLKDHALIYAATGLEVFPLLPDKTPRTPNGMKDATTDPDQIEKWWTTWPAALIGCRIPPDIVVLDIDPKHHGMDTWTAIKAAYGPVPPTRGHRSGRGDGGGHRWFRRPDSKLSVKPINQWAREHHTGEAVGNHSWTAGIDLLHHGHRYTVLPPSPHPVTGLPYQWIDGQGLEVAPAELPGWLADLITVQPAPMLPPAPRLAAGDMDSIADWFTAEYRWADLLQPEGWNCVGGDGDSDGSKWRHPNATTAFSATVKHDCLFVYSTSTDFEVTEDGAPHGYTKFKAFAVLAHGGEGHQHLSEAARAARTLKDGTISSNGHGTRNDWSWVALTDGTGTPPSTNGAAPAVIVVPADGLRPIYWPDFWNSEHPDEDWLIEPILPRGRQVALWAVHKTGKSLITLEIAAAAAAGHPCLGNPAQPPIDVIYLDMEMTESDLHERLTSFGYDQHSPLTHLHYYLIPALPPLDTPAGAQALLGLVDRHQPALVIVDTTTRATIGEENSADTIRGFYRHTGMPLKNRGVSLLRLDHGGKNADLGQRGSSAKGDDVDLVWELRATSSGLELVRRDTRVNWVPERVTLQRHDDDILSHTIALEMAWPPGVEEVARLLDTLGLPLAVGRPTARAALVAAGHTARNDVLSRALKYRRHHRPGPEELI